MCAMVGDIFSDGTQDVCCDDPDLIFDAFQCTYTESGGVLTNDCAFMEACLNQECMTDPPAPGPPGPTPPHVPDTEGF